jgi:hypothetical protein
MRRAILGLLVLSALPAVADDRPVVVIQKAAYVFTGIERATRLPADLVFDPAKPPEDAPDGHEYVILRFDRLHSVEGAVPPELESVLTREDGVVRKNVGSTTICREGRCWGAIQFLVPERGVGYRFAWNDVEIDVPAVP